MPNTVRGKVLRFWNNVPHTTQEIVAYEFEDDDEPAKPETNMEKLAKDIEIARSNLVHCQGELMKAETLLNRCVDRYEEAETARNLRMRVRTEG